jgi:trehalose 6-phosphate synthase
VRFVLRFLVPLAVVLAIFAGLTAWLTDRTSRRWHEQDVTGRAELAVRGAPSLVAALAAGDHAGLKPRLDAITRDERIMASAICDVRFRTVAATESLPERYRCEALPAALGVDGALTGRVRTARGRESGMPLHVALVPLLDRGTPVGAVALVHDMTYAEQRAMASRRFILGALFALALLAAAATLVLTRMTWRHWTEEMRRALRGDTDRQEFRPILADLRELAGRLAEPRHEPDQVRWGPERLRRALREHLEGERIIIVANREPYIHERTATGDVKVVHPASGLVTALEPVMRACSGTWIAHGAGSADRETADARGRVRVPPGAEQYTLRRVWLSAEEEKGYYYGFANEGLWPLCHVAHTRPVFRADDWQAYQLVNQRFADAVVQEAEQPDPVVLVQDYHFAMAPAMLRARLPRATVLTFWHIPWPNVERFGICPWRRELLLGLLGSSIVGFHTQGHCNNFLEAADRFLEARIDREVQGVFHRGRMTLVRSYPISVEWPNHWAETAPPVAECRASVFADLGLPPNALLGVGVDRLDYTKGIEERLLAVERVLERYPDMVGRFTFVQLAAPSRTIIERYRQLNEAVEAVAARVNERFGRGDYRPVILLREHHEPPKVFRYYRAADVCYVSSLHDGMNLVAKEFVAARDDERGVLVLSSFTGAARELTEALVVNPYDIEQASAALHRALTMPPAEQAQRLRVMRDLVAEFNVYRWAGRMLVDAARLRRRDRIAVEMPAA